MTVKDAVVLRFKDICKERNIKYNELATISGVTPSTVYSMMDENAEIFPLQPSKSFVMVLI